MKEDEYIDLDKINGEPRGDQAPGFSKNEEKAQQEEQKPKLNETKEKTQQTKTVKNKNKASKKKSTSSSNKKTTKTATKTTKKKNKKNKKTNNKKNNKSKNNKIIYILLGLILLAIIVILITTLTKTTPETKENKALLLINGVPLMQDEVQTRADWLRLVNGVPLTDEQVLELSTEIELMYQEAQKRNITINQDEIDQIFEEMAQSAEFTQEELKTYIENLGINYELLNKIIKKEMYARELTTKETENIDITKEQLQEYYENNTEQFAHDELVTIRHIQINKENKTENEALLETENIMQQINENKSNFCELVEQHTDDWNTMFDCGEYVFEKQPEYTDDLIRKSFEMDENEMDLLQTENANHIIWKINTTPAGFAPFIDVEDIIKAQVELQLIEQKYYDLITRLTNEAEIEDLTEKNEEENVIELNLSDLINETDILNETTDDEEAEEQKTETNDTKTQTDTEIQNDTVNDTKTEDEPTITYEKEIIDVENKIKNLAECLTNNGAKMYKVYWSPHSEKQAQEFGEYFDEIISVECDADGENPKMAECEKTLQKEYPTWPTWKINDELYEGYQNLNTLSKLSGCPY